MTAATATATAVLRKGWSGERQRGNAAEAKYDGANFHKVLHNITRYTVGVLALYKTSSIRSSSTKTLRQISLH
jgi:hypothetical protein